MGIAPLPERAYQDDSNAIVKDYTMTQKEVVCLVREMIQKANQIKHHEMSI